MPKPKTRKSKLRISEKRALEIYDLMVKTRVLEERLIKMYKQNDGFFWIGGPGEEAFNVSLGLQLHKGQGPKFDYFHGHYRSLGVLVAMGAEPIDALRQMKNTATDPYSGGRNFCGHASIYKWNVCPITSPIEVQYVMAPGTALANKRASKSAITVVTGGDAGTAEGDFASSLIWSSRPVEPLPILLVVTNNKWGISTPAESQHGETYIADRGKAFNIKTRVLDGNDVEEIYLGLEECIAYVRKERKPLLLEAFVSRLYGHSSASGANLNTQEADPIKLFEKKLLKLGVLTEKNIATLWERYNEEMLALYRKVREEPQPSGDSIFEHVFYGEGPQAFPNR